MPRKSISFELDFMIKDILPKFAVKQFDDVSFNIKPKKQGLDYDTTGMTGKIFIGVNNDMFMQTKNITVSNNNVNILLDRNMLQKNGRAYAEVELTDSNGTITSSSFIFNIDSKIGEGATIPGSIEGFVAKYERLISEFKSQVNETISNCNANVDNKLNTVDSLINVKISDFEKRFNRLTSSQQQDAEVIDARVGENGKSYASLGDRLNEVDSQLEHIEKQVSINPDMFDGGDIEKLESAIEYCYSNNIPQLELNRVYDVTGGSVKINGRWQYLNITGNGIVKNDEGYVFIGTQEGDRQSPYFTNCEFKTTTNAKTILLNSDNFVRTSVTRCLFNGMALLRANRYIQSVHVTNTWTGGLNETFIKATSCYDTNLVNNTFEASSYGVLELIGENGVGNNVNCRIENNVIEGMRSSNAINIVGGTGISICNNYFEYNQADIVINDTGTKLVVGEICNNTTCNVVGEYSIIIPNTLATKRLNIDNNSMAGDSSSTYYLINRNLLPPDNGLNYVANNKFYPEHYVKRITDYDLDITSTDDGVVVNIPLSLTNYGNIRNLDTMFLLYVRGIWGGDAGTSTNVDYVDHCLLCVNLTHAMNTGTIKTLVKFNLLSNSSTSSDNIIATFKESGTQALPILSDKFTIQIEFKNWKYPEKTHATIKSVSGLESLFYV